MQTLLDVFLGESPQWEVSRCGAVAWSKTMGVLALGSGESELAAVVRAATDGLRLQSILGDFDLCGHVAIKSEATVGSEPLLRTKACNWVLVDAVLQSITKVGREGLFC